MTSLDKDAVLSQLHAILKEFFVENTPAFIPGTTPVRLAQPTYDDKEVMQILDSLLSKNITLNQHVSNKVGQFENKWADYIGVTNGVMVNSGSSANLLALHVLSNPLTKNRIAPGDEVITPALTWSTTVSPILNINATPVLVDVCGLDDLTIDPARIEQAITEKTKAIMPVHLLGYPCHMKEIMEIADTHNLYVIEDTCEAHGAAWGTKKAGSYGHLSTFSFFFSHHFTTIEGGMMMTQHDEFAELESGDKIDEELAPARIGSAICH